MKSCGCNPVFERSAVRGRSPAVLSSQESPATLRQSAVSVPGGRSLLGTNRPVLTADGEGPLRTTRVKPFRIEPTAVTNARFEAFVTATGYETDAEKLGSSFVFENFLPAAERDKPRVAAAPWWCEVEGACWREPCGPGSADLREPDHPVVHISWHDAGSFASWAGGRLPSEAEWEHAARGGLGDVRFPWGDEEPDDVGHFPCNIWQGTFPEIDLALDGFAGLAPAQSFAPNGYGLFNMVGNTWEWTSEPFKVRSLKKSARVTHAGARGYKLVKGGSFLCHASYCYRYRIAARSGTSPDSSTSHTGFRLVYDMD
ncbi:formylglycine-generating enzyme family protein [Nitratireductor sp. XY-223]|uniref:formylglycine-generating enzyme family protein n=1 Tax=Nitratireductor sp. XY-223 TaxID=2561926 RepID=UPI0010AA716A|nr:formylglycine-generating enzyme family protein [Nitratireductor sp. XY-223]